MSPPLRLLLLASVVAIVAARNTKLREVFSWKQLDFAFPTPQARQSAIASGEYIPKNVLPLAMEIWKDRVFVTLPRRRPGIPATLTYVTMPSGTRSTSPKLVPYPDWATNKLPEDGAEEGDSPNIVSTFRVRVDTCDRLWVMDTGISDLEGEAIHHVPSRILVYDLNTDTLIRKIPFPEEYNTPDSFYANILVDTDVATGCDNAFAYMSDLGTYAVVVYSFKEDISWRVQHHYFHFDPLRGNYNVAGVTFQWTDGVFGMTLSKRNKGGYKTVYFQSLSGNHLFSVSNRVLQNRTHPTNYNDYRIVGDKGLNTQSTTLFMHHKTGVLFYTLVNQDAIACWNSNEPTLTSKNQGVVTSDMDTMVYPSDLKIDSHDMLWTLSNRMPFYLYRELNPQQVNFRIFTGSVTDALKGTVCASQRTSVRVDGEDDGGDEEKGDEEKGDEEKGDEEKGEEEKGEEEKGDEKKGDEEKGDEEKGDEEKGDEDKDDTNKDVDGESDDDDKKTARPEKVAKPLIWSSR